jgi:hypothetical protein
MYSNIKYTCNACRTGVTCTNLATRHWSTEMWKLGISSLPQISRQSYQILGWQGFWAVKRWHTWPPSLPVPLDTWIQSTHVLSSDPIIFHISSRINWVLRSDMRVDPAQVLCHLSSEREEWCVQLWRGSPGAYHMPADTHRHPRHWENQHRALGSVRDIVGLY